MTTFILAHPIARRRAQEAIATAPEGSRVKVEPPRRSASMSDKFHAMCDDVARQCLWQGKKRTKDQWKFLFVSGHAIATKQETDNVPGLEGEYVNLRESTASMGKARTASLIEYTQAWGDMNGVVWSDDAVSHERSTETATA